MSLHRCWLAIGLFWATAYGQVSLNGVIDFHAHSDPDSLPRKIDAIDLARLAKERGLRGLVLKNHYESTASLAYLVRKEVPGIEIFGGIDLNLTVGGINPAAVERMTMVKGGWGRVVWMPTFDAENQVRFSKENRPFVPVSKGGQLLPAVREVIALAAKHGLTLETGHSSAAEGLMIVREAHRAGVQHMVVTHAMLAPVHMTAAQMQEAAREGAYLEFVYNGLVGPAREFEIGDYAKAIRAVGPEHCILSSDLGQPANPLHPDGLAAFFAALRKEGFSESEIDQMSKTNPARALGLAAQTVAQAPQPDGGGVRPGSLPASWITGGPDCASVPPWQVHAYNEDFYILRESGCTNYEKPFLYLLFGKDRALLEDTGAGKSDAARVAGEVIARWLTAKGRTSLPLVVAHSHAHGDHVAGDPGFREMPNVTMVPLTVEGTQKFFGIDKWPDGAGQIDLGDRVLDVIPIPGHDILSIAFYDRQTGVLLTGDSLYPGRLYVRDFPEFVRSTNRLVEFTRGKIVAHVLGTHIEQSATPYKDYPAGTKYQPEEHELALSRAHLLELKEALDGMEKPVRLALRDFTLWPQAPRPAR